MRLRTMLPLVAAIAALSATGAAFAQAGPPDDVRGQVVAVRQTTANEGSLTEIQVRTRGRQEMWLRLGAEEPGAFQVGDRVRARYRKSGDAALVTDIRNGRTGERTTVRAQDGTLMKQQDRDRTRAGTRERRRDRTCEPGTGGGRGSGNRGSGSGCPRRG